MRCEGGVCNASLSTYCLQEHRDAPTPHDPYYAASLETFDLVLDMPDGTALSLDAAGYLTFEAERSYKSVRVSIPGELLDEYGATTARVVVKSAASLIPVPEEDDLNPLTTAEIEYTVTHARRLGDVMVDNGPMAIRAKALSVMVRAMPEWQAWANRTEDDLWSFVETQAALEQVPAEQTASIRSEFDACVDSHASSSYFGIDYCIRQRHDDVMLDINKAFWDAAGGS